jgi:hypothetical protein
MEIDVHRGGRRGMSVANLVPHVGDPTLWLVGAFVAVIMVWAVAEHVQRLAFARYAAASARHLQSMAAARLVARPSDSESRGDAMSRIVGTARG